MSESSSSGSGSSWLSWKTIGAATGAVVVATAVGLYVTRRSYNRYKEEKRRQKKARRRRKKEVAALDAAETHSESAVKVDEEVEEVVDEAPLELDNEKLQQLVESSLTRLERNGKFEEEEEKLLKALRNIEAADFDVKSRVAGVQFLLVYYALKLQGSESAEEAKAVHKAQLVDLKLAWELIQGESSNEKEQQILQLFALDIAQRMSDPQKMESSFSRVMERYDTLSNEELLMAFHIAPLLGRWEETRTLGGKLIATEPMFLEIMHNQSMRVGKPCYAVVYELAKNEISKGPAPIDSLVWASYKTDATIKLIDVVCKDKRKADTVWADAKEKVQNLPPGTMHVTRMGACAQVANAYRLPVRMFGPANDQRINVKGYIDLNPRGAGLNIGGEIRHTETLELANSSRNGSEETWTGKFTLTQEKAPNGRGASMEFAHILCVYDVTLRLVKVAVDADDDSAAEGDSSGGSGEGKEGKESKNSSEGGAGGDGDHNSSGNNNDDDGGVDGISFTGPRITVVDDDEEA